MALGNAYDYIRKYVDKNFAYHDPFNTSYSSEDMIKDLEYDQRFRICKINNW